jgi:hypothetical protein
MSDQQCFMVLYNYYDNHYSIIKRMNALVDAYDYICYLEKIQREDDNIQFTLLYGTNSRKIKPTADRNALGICCIPFDNYASYKTCDNGLLSQYVIVPMD